MMTEHNNIQILNMPNSDELWQGIGGHFDGLNQVFNELIDNSISNFIANPKQHRNILISITELPNDEVNIIIEDTGTGIKNLNEALTLGSKASAESLLNEHGFGLKHGLAYANPNITIINQPKYAIKLYVRIFRSKNIEHAYYKLAL